VCEKEARCDCRGSGVKERGSGTERNKRIHIGRLVQQRRPCLDVKAPSRPGNDERREGKEEPAYRVTADRIQPWERLAQSRIEYAHGPTHQRVLHALHAAHARHAHQGHGQDHRDSTSHQADTGFQAQLSIFEQLVLVMFFLLVQNGLIENRDLCAVACTAYLLHQARSRSYVCVKGDGRVVQHEIDGRILHPGFAGESPLNKRLARGTSHTADRNRDPFQCRGRSGSVV
jgi:hypothetical protein